MPSWTNSEGVVWLPEDSFVHAESSGFVRKLATPSGSFVDKGTLLLQCEDEQLDMELVMLESRIHELQMMKQRNRVQNIVEADLVGQQIAALQKELAVSYEKHESLNIHSEKKGKFVIPASQDMLGRFVRRGELLAYVVPQEPPTVRVLVAQDRVALVRDKTRSVNLMLVNSVGEEVPGRIIREVPEATTELPSLALSVVGGGEVAVDPQGDGAARSFLTHFVFDLGTDAHLENHWYGQRVYVRFEHGLEPAALQLYRAVRQLFLSRFNV